MIEKVTAFKATDGQMFGTLEEIQLHELALLFPTVWECPNCGWVVSHLAYTSIIFDAPCPRCKTPYSHFHYHKTLSTQSHVASAPATSRRLIHKTENQQPKKGHMARGKVEDLPGIEGPGVAPFKDSALTKYGNQLDELREQKATIAEEITQVEKNAHDRMVELKITQYRYGDRLMFIKPGKDHVKTKEVQTEGVDTEDEEDSE